MGDITWLPLGSAVRVHGVEPPVAIAGFMFIDRDSGQPWDYIGYPYPVGRVSPREAILFNRDQVEHVLLTGYLDAEGLAFGTLLDMREGQFEEAKKRYLFGDDGEAGERQ